MKAMNHLFFLFIIVISALMPTAAFADISTKSPVACSGASSPWTNCGNAFIDGTNQSTAAVSASTNRTSQWSGYGFSIPAGASIDNVMIRTDFWASNFRGAMNVRVSGDGGATFGPNHVVGSNTAEKTFIIDVTGDAAWTPAMINNNLRINATCFMNASGSKPTCRLDWIPVNVTYTPFDYSVSASPDSGTVAAGENATTTAAVLKISGGTENVALTISGCPTAATCTLNPPTGNPSYNSTLTIATTTSTPNGVSSLTINANSSSGLGRSASYTLNVTKADLIVESITFNPASPVEGPATVEANITVMNAGTATASSTVLNVTLDGAERTRLGTSPLAPGQRQTLTVSDLLQVGNHTYGAYADADLQVAESNEANNQNSNTVEVIQGFDFSMSASPASAYAAQATSTASTISVNLTGGTTKTVNLSISGCPTAATCTLSTASGNPTYTSTLNVTPSGSTPIGTYVVAVNGTGGGKGRHATFNVTVTDTLIYANKITASPPNGTAPMAVSFTSMVVGGNSPISYLWDFADGFTSTAEAPQHTYNFSGIYNVNLTVTDLDGDTLLNSTIITVN